VAKEKTAATVQRNLGVLCNLDANKRLHLLAEGMPILLASARSFWAAASAIPEMPREAEVLRGFAAEEAAKILILVDLVRCPHKLVPSRIKAMVGWFYDHLARLLYAEAQSWKPITVGELRTYIDSERRSHYVDGFAGEYIMPNSTVFNREAAMYADVLRYCDSEPSWNDPLSHLNPHPVLRAFKPQALRVAEALDALGLLTLEGLTLIAEVWSTIEFSDERNHTDWERLAQRTVERAIDSGLPSEAAKQEHLSILGRGWQAPMYHLDLRRLDVPLDQLKREQVAAMWSEIGHDDP
jgi:hypothetical protein